MVEGPRDLQQAPCGSYADFRSIFSLIVSWNDFLLGREFMNSTEQLPLTVGVMLFFEGVHVDGAGAVKG